MDSKMACRRALLENDRQVDGCFTSYKYRDLPHGAEEGKERFMNDTPAAAQPHTEPGPEGTPSGSGSYPLRKTPRQMKTPAPRNGVEKPAAPPDKPAVQDRINTVLL
jgi:hypothetical protein